LTGENPPGYVKARKPIDFGNAGQCWDLETAVRGLKFKVDPDGNIEAIPVVLFDPCQATQNDANGNPVPLKTATVYPTANNRQALLGTFPGRFAFQYNTPGVGTPQASPGLTGVGPQADAFAFYGHQVSGLNAAQSFLIDTRGLSKSLAISMVASAGTATLAVHVTTDLAAVSSNYPASSGGPPPTSWTNNDITIDSIAAALTTVKQYTETTVGGTIALSPLSFRWILITVGAAGAGNTTTLDVAMK